MSSAPVRIFNCPACQKHYVWNEDRAGRKAMCTCGLIIRFPKDTAGSLEVVGRKPPEVKPDRVANVANTALAMEIEALQQRPKRRPSMEDEEAHPEHRPAYMNFTPKPPGGPRPDSPEKGTGPAPKIENTRGEFCPECGVVLAAKSKICMACGYDIVLKARTRRAADPAYDPNAETKLSAEVWIIPPVTPVKKPPEKNAGNGNGNIPKR